MNSKMASLLIDGSQTVAHVPLVVFEVPPVGMPDDSENFCRVVK